MAAEDAENDSTGSEGSGRSDVPHPDEMDLSDVSSVDSKH